MKKTIIKHFIFAFFLITALNSYADKLYLKSGKVVEGKIIEHNQEKILITISGVPLTYYQDEIERVEGGQEKFITKVVSQDKRPQDIFQELSPAVVVITTDNARGSGFIVSSDGVIVTNYHVVSGASTIEVKLKDGRTFPVKGIINYDRGIDLCILKIEGRNLSTVELGNVEVLPIGGKVFVIGAPLGFEYSITEGLYSGKREVFNRAYLQFSASTSPGNSGGPLIDAKGTIIGVVTWVANVEGSQNINFAVPIDEVRKFISDNIVRYPLREFTGDLNESYNQYQLGLSAYFQYNFYLAIDYFKEAIRLDPNFADGYSSLINSYVLINDYDQALSIAEVALQKSFKKNWLFFSISYIYKDQGQYSKALEYLNQSLNLMDNNKDKASVFAQIADVYSIDKNYVKCEEYANKALALNKDDYVAYYCLGVAYWNQGVKTKGIEYLEKAKNIYPSAKFTLVALATAYYETGQYSLAIENCDKLLELGYEVSQQLLDNLKPHRKSGLAVGDFKDSGFNLGDLELDRLIMYLDEEGQYVFSKAVEAYKQQQYSVSIELLQVALSKAPSSLYDSVLKVLMMVTYDAGKYYMSHAAYDDAINYFRQTIDNLKSFSSEVTDNITQLRAKCYYNLGIIYTVKNDAPKAKAYLNQLKTLNIDLAKKFAQELMKKIDALGKK